MDRIKKTQPAFFGLIMLILSILSISSCPNLVSFDLATPSPPPDAGYCPGQPRAEQHERSWFWHELAANLAARKHCSVDVEISLPAQ